MVHIATAAVAVYRGMRKEEERREKTKRSGQYIQSTTTATVFTKEHKESHNILTHARVDVSRVHPVDWSVLEVFQFTILHQHVHTHIWDSSTLLTVRV